MRYIKLIFILILFTLISGCGVDGKTSVVHKRNESIKEQTYSAEDAAGRILTFVKKPERIASLTYGTDEILLALVDEKRVIGLSRWAGDEDISFIGKEQAERIGRKLNENVEAVTALKPDLVIVSTSTSQDFVAALESLKIPVYIAESPKNYEQMLQKISGIAGAVGESANGKKLIETMNKKLSEIEEKLSKLEEKDQKTALAFNFTGAMGRKGDLIDSIMTMAKIKNGAALAGLKDKGQLLSKEKIIFVNPDIFLLPTWNFDNNQDVDGYAKDILNDPAYKDLKVVKEGKIGYVPDKYRYVASQHIVEAVEAFAKVVYPELF